MGAETHETLSQLSVSPRVWKTRLMFKHGLRGEERAKYEVTMVQVRSEGSKGHSLTLRAVHAIAAAKTVQAGRSLQEEGVHKGLWLTSSLIRDDVDVEGTQSYL